MSKFKVRCVAQKTDEKYFTVGKIYEWENNSIRNDRGYLYSEPGLSVVGDDPLKWSLSRWYGFEKVQDINKILITSDGTTTLARLYEADKVIRQAEAKCSPSDTFDFAVGAELAYQRLMHPIKAPANKYEGMSDDELSRAICSYRRCNNWGSTSKNCPSRPYCHDGKGSYAYILEHRSEAISYLLAEDEVKQDKPAEPAKEPVKLYCIKDYKPGKWLTKGNVYEFVPGVGTTYDSGFVGSDGYGGNIANYAKCNPSFWSCLVPLVKRPAKKGEYIIVTNMDRLAYLDGRFDMEDILRVTDDDTSIIDQWKGKAVGFENVTHPNRPYHSCVILNKDYLVLDGYQPEPKQPEPKWYNGNVVCIKGGKYHTLGAVYEIKDGIINHNTGDGYNWGAPVQSVKQLNDASVPQFAEFKGEAHD